MGEDQKGWDMSKIAGELNAEMMHPKVIHEQRKALFAEMVGKTGSTQSVLDRLIQEIDELRQQLDAKEAEVDDLGDDLAQVKRQLAKRDKQVMLLHFELFNSAEYIDTLGGTSLEARKTLAATEQWK